MTRSRRDAPALGVPVVNDIAAARARRDADKAARQARHIADSQAKRASDLAKALETSGTPEALMASMKKTIEANAARAVLGDAAGTTASEDDPIPPPPTKGAA